MITATAPIIKIKDGQKGWYAGQRRLDILKKIDLDVCPGESLAIMGPSGAGKSTLLHILGFLTSLDHGLIYFQGRPITNDSADALQKIRMHIGMIFQDAKLIPELTLLGNVCLPLAHRGIWPKQQKILGRQALEQVGLSDRIHHRPSQLSGGEQTRAAIARALIQEPRVILADEPTGSLDSLTGEKVSDLLLGTVTPRCTLVMVTHNQDLADKASRVVYMKDGQLDGAADA